MKILGVVILVAVILGGLVGTLVVQDPGYILISYNNTIVEMSLWVGLFILFLLLTSFWLFGYVVRNLAMGQRGVSRFLSGRKIRAARSQTVRGLLVMAEGRWLEARKLLLASAPKAETPLINYLNAARTSHELGEPDARDEHLKLAHESTPGAKFAVTLTQAEFNIDEGQYEQALAALLTLRKRAPKHRAVLLMLVDCYKALGDWMALADMTSDLKKSGALNEFELAELQAQIWRGRVKNEENVAQTFKKMPKALKSDSRMAVDWVNHLLQADRNNDAEEATRLALTQKWSSELAGVYGSIQSDDPKRQLVTAQGWAKQHSTDANLALSLGRLSLQNEQFEQAREYFESSLRLEPCTAVYQELGRLCIKLGDEARGTEYLLTSLDSLPKLPQPAAPSLKRASV